MSNCLVRKLGQPTALWLAFAIAAALLAFPVRSTAQYDLSTKAAPRLPSIIFILADDLGYGDLGCYGQTEIKTPAIDQLAAEGMRFTSFYAGSTVCAPSRASLMTGKDTGHSDIRGNAVDPVPLAANEVTVATILKGAGYNTGAIGKWGMGERGSTGLPGKQGFDEWFGYLNQVEAHNYYPTTLNRSGKDIDRDLPVQQNENGKLGKYSNDYFTEAAQNFIRIKIPDQFNHYRPFFLYLAFTIPHANNELAAKTGNGMQVPQDAPYSDKPWPQTEKNKASMISRLDRYVATIMDYLKKTKIDDNTIVIFASDNGAHKEGGVDPKFFKSSGPLRGIKRDLYEGGIRVPFIVRWPAKIKAGSTSDLPAAFWDFLPTVADIAQRPAPASIQGISLLPTLLGKPQADQHEFLYWEFHENGFKQAVRMGDWKAVRFGIDGPLELYNLTTDLGEKTNVAADHPDVVAKIEQFLKTARTDDKRWPTDTAAHSPKKDYENVVIK